MEAEAMNYTSFIEKNSHKIRVIDVDIKLVTKSFVLSY